MGLGVGVGSSGVAAVAVVAGVTVVGTAVQTGDITLYDESGHEFQVAQFADYGGIEVFTNVSLLT